jgi:hypothetical protein
MNRYCGMLLGFNICLIVVGCRRSGESRPPTTAEEVDILPAMNEKEIMFTSRPKDRKYKIWDGNVYEIDQEMKGKDKSTRKGRWSKIVENQERDEKDKDKAKEVQAAMAAAGVAESKQEFFKFASVAYDFMKLKKSNPRDFSQEEFYKYARRGGFFFNRKYLDKKEMEIFEEEVRIIRYLENGSITFVPDVDMNNPKKDYIIAHRPGGGGGGGGMGMGGGGMMGMGGGGANTPDSLLRYNRDENAFESKSASLLAMDLKVQDLRILHHYFIGFAAPHFMRPPVDARENELWNAQPFPLPAYDLLIKGLSYGDPAGTFRNVETRVPSVMKNPADAREIEKFKKHLTDNAPPGVLANLNNRVISVNLAANLRSSGDIVACRTLPELGKDKNDKEFIIGHWAIQTNGASRYAQRGEIAPFLAAPPAAKGQGMPGMPGMPK